MKKLVAVLVMMLLLVGRAQAQRTVDERRAVVPNGFVRIFLLNGSVTVKGWDKDSLAVTGTVYEPPGERFGVGVTPKGAKLGIWSDSEQKLKPSNITVWLPRRSQVWVKTTDAAIAVSDVTGGLDLFSVSGNIDISGTPAEAYAETMGGDITLRANTSSARIKTAAGALHVSGSIADLTAVTVSGPIDVAKAAFSRARLESVDGDIRYTGAFSSGALLDVTNHAGLIELVMPVKVSADFVVSQYSGQLQEEFGLGKKLSGGAPYKAREVAFTLGQTASARVTLRSFKGMISLRKF